MRCLDLLEVSDAPSLVGRLNRAIEHTAKIFFLDSMDVYTQWAIESRRRELGYHPKDQRAAGFQDFDQEEFDRINRDWYPGIWIENHFDDFFPELVYDLMEKVSQAITTVLQDHVRKNFGDIVPVCNATQSWFEGPRQRPVNQIYAMITYGNRYLGAYRCNSYKNDTRLEINIDPTKWTSEMKHTFGEIISWGYRKGDLGQIDWLSRDIVNTFMHEYAHLEQDLRGGYGSDLGLIPGKAGRYISKGPDDDYTGYLGKVSEIDAHATGAAAETINGIISQRARYDARWKKDWTADDIPADQWNEAIKDAIIGVAKGEIPKGEFQKYWTWLDPRDRYPRNLPKHRFLRRARQKFLRTYINRLRQYLRPETGEPAAAKPLGRVP
jgi:hypothetical protein